MGNYGSADKITNVAFLNPANNIVLVVVNQTNSEQPFKILYKDLQFSLKVPGGTVTTFVLKNEMIEL